MRHMIKRVEALEARANLEDDVPRYALVTVRDMRLREDDPDDGPALPRWPPRDPDLLTAGALVVQRLAGESDPAFHARAADLARRSDRGMVPVLLPFWRDQTASP